MLQHDTAPWKENITKHHNTIHNTRQIEQQRKAKHGNTKHYNKPLRHNTFNNHKKYITAHRITPKQVAATTQHKTETQNHHEH